MTKHRFALCLVAILFMLLISVRAARAATPEEIQAIALQEARKHIPKTMKNPKSAEFDEETLDSQPLIGWGDGTASWRRVTGVVRGTNSFGGVVPNEWTAYVAEINDELAVHLIELEDSIVYEGELASIVLEERAKLLREMRAELEKENRERAAIAEAEREKREEEQRVRRIQNQGREAGSNMARAMTLNARMRITKNEAASRAKKLAKKADMNADDTALFVEGFVSGVEQAKAATATKK